MTAEFAFASLEDADLVVDAVYRGDVTKGLGGDPVWKLLPRGGNAGGFRISGKGKHGYRYVALNTSGVDPDWPDSLDSETGLFTYYGDNKKPGQPLHRPRGNKCLRYSYDQVHGGSGDRHLVPPFLVFEATGRGRDMRFLGLAAPGAEQLESDGDLVAVWRTAKSGRRFQNYKAVFTILETAVVSRSWINSLEPGSSLGPECPPAWREWVKRGKYLPLRAPRTIQIRSKDAQLPGNATDRRLLATLHQYFADDPVGFEACAAALWRMVSPRSELTVTRPTRDGGRDAIGVLSVGPESDPVHLDFALEAKCYSPTNGVGVKEMSRLISRLRHRQFGVLVTTSYVGPQAYQEVRDDEHPVVILAASDILMILRERGLSTKDALGAWLSSQFPRQ